MLFLTYGILFNINSWLVVDKNCTYVTLCCICCKYLLLIYRFNGCLKWTNIYSVVNRYIRCWWFPVTWYVFAGVDCDENPSPQCSVRPKLIVALEFRFCGHKTLLSYSLNWLPWTSALPHSKAFETCTCCALYVQVQHIKMRNYYWTDYSHISFHNLCTLH